MYLSLLHTLPHYASLSLNATVSNFAIHSIVTDDFYIGDVSDNPYHLVSVEKLSLEKCSWLFRELQ